jgi:hypothetical protein
MSANNSSIAITYPIMSQLFDSIGQKYYVNCLLLFVHLPDSLIGFMFNLLSLIVLNDKEFADVRLFAYLRVYTANSCILNLFCGFIFLVVSPQILAWSNTIEAYEAFLHGVLPVISTTYFFGTMLDILISLDRIGIFRRKVSAWIKLGPYKTCLITFICVLVVQFPFFFDYQPASREFHLNATFVQRVWFNSLSAFGASMTGEAISISQYLIRDILPVGVLLATNVASIYLLKQHLQTRSKLLKRSPADRSAPTAQMALSAPTVLANVAEQTREAPSAASSRPDQKLTIMVVIMCTFTIFAHITQIFIDGYFYAFSDLLGFQLLGFGSWTSITVKHGLNFWFFFAFNAKFRAVVIKYVKFR